MVTTKSTQDNVVQALASKLRAIWRSADDRRHADGTLSFTNLDARRCLPTRRVAIVTAETTH